MARALPLPAIRRTVTGCTALDSQPMLALWVILAYKYSTFTHLRRHKPVIARWRSSCGSLAGGAPRRADLLHVLGNVLDELCLLFGADQHGIARIHDDEA